MEEKWLEFAQKTDEINKRLVSLIFWIVLIGAILMGYREYLTYTNYEYPEITQTQTGISNVQGDDK